jgi:hypothetical protein
MTISLRIIGLIKQRTQMTLQRVKIKRDGKITLKKIVIILAAFGDFATYINVNSGVSANIDK